MSFSSINVTLNLIGNKCKDLTLSVLSFGLSQQLFLGTPWVLMRKAVDLVELDRFGGFLCNYRHAGLFDHVNSFHTDPCVFLAKM